MTGRKPLKRIHLIEFTHFLGLRCVHPTFPLLPHIFHSDHKTENLHLYESEVFKESMNIMVNTCEPPECNLSR